MLDNDRERTNVDKYNTTFSVCKIEYNCKNCCWLVFLHLDNFRGAVVEFFDIGTCWGMSESMYVVQLLFPCLPRKLKYLIITKMYANIMMID